MCVSTAEAGFSETIVYTGRRRDAELGLVNVFGYQNRAHDASGGPNAMLLHLPTRDLTPENFISTGRGRTILDDMAAAVPFTDLPFGSAPAVMSAFGDAVTIFEHDVYTVLLARDATAIPDALSRVEPRRRPVASARLCEFYADRFGDHAIVLCCFDNADAAKSNPLLLWYPPNDPDRLVLPAVDDHLGNVPALGAPVVRDHVLIWSTDDADAEWGQPVHYRERLRHKVTRFLPERVTGLRVHGFDPEHVLFRNGDIAIDHDDLLADRLDRVHLTPTP